MQFFKAVFYEDNNDIVLSSWGCWHCVFKNSFVQLHDNVLHYLDTFETIDTKIESAVYISLIYWFVIIANVPKRLFKNLMVIVRLADYENFEQTPILFQISIFCRLSSVHPAAVGISKNKHCCLEVIG